MDRRPARSLHAMQARGPALHETHLPSVDDPGITRSLHPVHDPSLRSARRGEFLHRAEYRCPNGAPCAIAATGGAFDARCVQCRCGAVAVGFHSPCHRGTVSAPGRRSPRSSEPGAERDRDDRPDRSQAAHERARRRFGTACRRHRPGPRPGRWRADPRGDAVAGAAERVERPDDGGVVGARSDRSADRRCVDRGHRHRDPRCSRRRVGLERFPAAHPGRWDRGCRGRLVHLDDRSRPEAIAPPARLDRVGRRSRRRGAGRVARHRVHLRPRPGR